MTADTLRVLKIGDTVLIRSAFSPEQDLVVSLGKGSNRQVNFVGARLVAPAAAFSAEATQQGVLFHPCGDDASPFIINGGYIGGNHGCPDLCVVASPAHGRTTADIGSAWVDGAGTRFHLIRVVDDETLWFLSENRGTNTVWRFTREMVGPSLTSASGKVSLPIAVKTGQLRPACRVRRQEYLADGKKPLRDGEVTYCRSLDVVEEYDIINVGSLLRDILAHPGVEPDFTADRLEGVVANHIIYRFLPGGTTLIDYTSRALQEFEMGYMGFNQSARLVWEAGSTHEYYVPKTLPFEQNGIRYDFRSVQDLSAAPPKEPFVFSVARGNVEDPDNLPERFIQFVGRRENGQTVRQVGYALGYSLTEGLTRPAERARNASSAISLYPVKSYPVAVDRKMGALVPAGTTFHCLAYRQYFDPRSHANATCVYWHPEGEGQVVYVDYHRSVEHDTVRLPAEWAGKAITIIEQTPSLTLHAHRIGPGGSLELSASGGHGCAVIKVHDAAR
ncbi:MAG: hypothetical protein HY321_03160 [Armatimonadetes bacterium]|nr:hypothetical protein [Armatimonadota bacterium]